MSRVAIGSDHAGFELKTHFVQLLTEGGHDVLDHGTDSPATVDYPPICAAVGRSVRDGEADVGIVLGGSGQGEQILQTFLTTEFEGGRHARRLAEITDLEARF